MAILALSFNKVDLTPVDNNDGQIWVTSADLAKAIGYKSSRSISNLYNANSCEFTSSMTEVIETVTSLDSLGLTVKTRIFSLRGCHLIGMFARTNEAKKFRQWVLNVLDGEIDKINAERDSLSFQHNQACATTALVKRDLSRQVGIYAT